MLTHSIDDRYPKPFEQLLEDCGESQMSRAKKIILIVGNSDDMSPPEGAMRCYEKMKQICGGEEKIELVTHEGGHSVPIHDKKVCEIMLKHCS